MSVETLSTEARSKKFGAQEADGIVRCDACPVLCRIRPGRSGACSRYANADGHLVRTDPVVLLHDESHGAPLVDALARHGDGLAANALPLAVNAFISNLSFGARSGPFLQGLVAIAAVLLLSLRIAAPEAFNRLFQDTPLEVILVNTRSQEAPNKAAALAQANLAGGGEAERGRETMETEHGFHGEVYWVNKICGIAEELAEPRLLKVDAYDANLLARHAPLERGAGARVAEERRFGFPPGVVFELELL